MSKPKLTTRAPTKVSSIGGYRIRTTFEYNFNTFTFSSLNWLYVLFYNQNIKILPSF